MIGNFNTDHQYYTLPEKAFTALNYLTRGQCLDLRSIADHVNRLKLNLIYPEVDGDFLQNVVMLNGYSIESFNVVIKKMGLAE